MSGATTVDAAQTDARHDEQMTANGSRIQKPAAISLRDVSVRFPQPDGTHNTVLSGLDLDVPDGQFLAVVGRSGGGKTTVLNLVAGVVTPTEGQVTVLGSDPHAARTQLGFMMARDALLPWRSARRNVEYGLELRGMRRAERRTVSQRWLEAVHLDGAGNLWPWQLSQGMRQRVALARTWALDPDLLLMDEPFAALDAQTRISVQTEFLDLWQGTTKRTVLFVTHDLAEAIALADRVVLIGEGRILEDVTIDFERPRDLSELALDPEFQRLHTQLRSNLL